MSDMRFWIGTYTGDRGDGEGIYAASLTDRGVLAIDALAAAVGNPAYLVSHPSGRTVYAAEEDNPGGVSVFACDRSALRRVSHVVLPSHPCHITVSPDGRNLLTANYIGGSISTMNLAAEGGLSGGAKSLVLTGSGSVSSRQDRAHPHAIAWAPDGSLIVTDLGNDAVWTLRLDRRRRTVTVIGRATLPAGCGPRHLIVHPSGHVFVLTELMSMLVVLAPTPDYAHLTVVSTSPATACGASESAQSAAISLSVDGEVIYTSTRGDDVITTHRVIGMGTRARPIADVNSGGRWPRDLIAVEGRVLVANEQSHDIASFEIDRRSQVPKLIGTASVPSPACVVVA